MTTTPDTGPADLQRVADLPCPKCGHADVSIAYCDGCALRPLSSLIGNPDDRCIPGHPEHFHRRCRRCGYRWRTDDALTARKVCDR
jgi:hypothetical protein